jgi:hypothetical protein
MEEFRICIERRVEAEGMLQARKESAKISPISSPSLRQKTCRAIFLVTGTSVDVVCYHQGMGIYLGAPETGFLCYNSQPYRIPVRIRYPIRGQDRSRVLRNRR